MDELDVLIIGGGLVGASLAIALDDAGLRVALAEASASRLDLQASEDERNLALARASVNALESLGVLDARSPITPIRRVHVSRRGEFGALRLDAQALGLPSLGAVIPARELGNALLRRLERCASLLRLAPAQASVIEPAPAAVAVELGTPEGTRRLRARLVVGADGTGSFVREALGIAVRRDDYAQSAIVTTVHCERALEGQAYERFTDTGPLALLPLGERRAGLVLSVPRSQAAATAALDDAAFIDCVQQRFGWRAGRLTRPGRRQAFPLARVIAGRTHGQRCVLVGNAAQTVHPLGAQGFNLGLRDALTLAELLRETAQSGTDPGAGDLLERHDERRRGDRAATTAFSDDLVRLMGNPFLPLRLARMAGFHLAERIEPLKRQIALRGMGFRGDVSHWGLMQ